MYYRVVTLVLIPILYYGKKELERLGKYVLDDDENQE
jgi:hypothetical protein